MPITNYPGPRNPGDEVSGRARLIGEEWRSVRQLLPLPFLLDLHDPSRLFLDNNPRRSRDLDAGINHNSPRFLMRYGHPRAQGPMGLAASSTEGFTRVRDVPLSQNEGIRYSPSPSLSCQLDIKLIPFIS